MDADTLSLLIILRQELHAIADSLKPKTEIAEDIMTNNGISLDAEDILKDSTNKNNNSQSELPSNEEEEEEKAEELKSKRINEQTCNPLIGLQIDELIQNYLTPSIKQLNQKQKRSKKRKQASLSLSNTNSECQSPSRLHFRSSISSSQSISNSNSVSPHKHPFRQYEPGQAAVMDNVSDYSANCGRCCRRFVTSLFCGCGLFQTIGILVVFLFICTVFIFYRANELTLILKELNHWKELSVKRVEYELSSEQKLAQINFDLDVDIDKLKMEHQHREHMEIINAKSTLTKEFIDKNTRTVTTTYWNLLTTETETVSQTIFSEEDIAFFQNNILYYGFDGNNAIGTGKKIPPMIEEKHTQKNETEEEDEISIEDEECDPNLDSFDQL